jgi:uncharacterized membrane protein
VSDRHDVDRIERQLGRVLGVGVRLSTVSLTAGMVVALLGLNSRVAGSLLAAGILLLVGTPVARVAASSIAYAKRRDWTFVVLTLIVLGELVASIVAAVQAR